MKIILCDDEKIIFEQMNILLEKFSIENHIKNDFLYFAKPSELFDYMQTNEADIIFMDLEFGDGAEDGIRWIKNIKKHFPRTVVIILTAYEKRYKEGYEARAFRFMTKPIREDELFAYLHVSMEELQFTKSISLMRRGIPHDILIRDICYLSAQSGGSELWTRTDVYYCEESLLQWEHRLPMDSFFRCHSKYLVNMAHIIKCERQILTLVNGEKIPVSRRRWKAFQLAYMKFDTKNYGL
ncbi:MAG: response regulator transcription factor [Lachnospiraceae bacterium]|nr:response regulator transcription factor [Lachnospiraceae bacterium]MBQ7782318.1 response regulator transcription factor [Lachnospiraceae bacterium]